MLKLIAAAALSAVVSAAAIAQTAPAIDPNATVTLTYAELAALIQAEMARADAARVAKQADGATQKVREAFAPKPAAQ